MTSLIIHTVGGLLIGAMLIEWTSFHWVFWFVACMALPVALACVFIVPPQATETPDKFEAGAAKWKSLDLVGVGILTGMNLVAYSYFHRSRARIVAVILFIFSVTSGSTHGWASPLVLVPLIISVLMVVGFFYWETLIPVEKAAMYVISNHRTKHGLTIYQTTPDVVLQQLLSSVRHRTIANILVEYGVTPFLRLVAKGFLLVGNIIGLAHVRSSLHDARQ
jgi:MFS family permease